MTALPRSGVRLLDGGCRCGAIRYRVADAFGYGMICHCSGCRMATGAANKPMLGIERDQVQVVAGEADLMIIGDDHGHDARCRRCGCFLYSVVRDGQFVHVAMGSLIDSPTRRPDNHIFVESKADWEVLPDDGLPRHEGYG
jgi:hypothetical protein